MPHFSSSSSLLLLLLLSMKNHLLVSLYMVVVVVLLLLLVSAINVQETESSSSSCVTDSSLEPAIHLDQKVKTLHIRMPSFWCEGTIPNDFVFTIEPHSDSSINTTSIYTLPTLHSSLLEVNQTTDKNGGNGTTTTTITTIVTILSKNTAFGPPGSFGVVIQVPAKDLRTVILERSFFWDQNSIKLRIRPGFTALKHIVSQTLQPFQDKQAIELEADVSTSTSPVTLDLFHHGRYHVIGNIHAVNVDQQSVSANQPEAADTEALVAVQIKGNVASGSISRAGTYVIMGNVTGSLMVNTTRTSLKDHANNHDDTEKMKNKAILTISGSCDNVTLQPGLGDTAACNTLVLGAADETTSSSLTEKNNNNMMRKSTTTTVAPPAALAPPVNFFSLQCTVHGVCQETGYPYHDGDDKINAANAAACQLVTQCPLFGQAIQVSKNEVAMTAPGYASSETLIATSDAGTSHGRLSPDLVAALTILC